MGQLPALPPLSSARWFRYWPGAAHPGLGAALARRCQAPPVGRIADLPMCTHGHNTPGSQRVNGSASSMTARLALGYLRTTGRNLPKECIPAEECRCGRGCCGSEVGDMVQSVARHGHDREGDLVQYQ